MTSRKLMYAHGARKKGDKKKDVYYTPLWFTNLLPELFPSGFYDPCPGVNDIAGSVRHERGFNHPGNFDGVKDGLLVDWLEMGLPVFVNPPFSDLKRWVKKIKSEADKGVRVVYFGKLDYRTEWGISLILSADLVVPIMGYTRYLNQYGVEYASATFQSCCAYWNISPESISTIADKLTEGKNGIN